MSEVVTIVVSGPQEVIEVVTTNVVEQVTVYTGEVTQGGGTATPISKNYYKATGSEGPSITIAGIGQATWSQVTQGAIPLEQVYDIPVGNQYFISGDNVFFGNPPQQGEAILFLWQ